MGCQASLGMPERIIGPSQRWLSGEYFEHFVDWAAKPGALARDHDWALDQDRMGNHEIDKLIVAPFQIAEIELVVGRGLLPQQFAGFHRHRCKQLDELFPAWRSFQIFNDLGFPHPLTDHG